MSFLNAFVTKEKAVLQTLNTTCNHKYEPSVLIRLSREMNDLFLKLSDDSIVSPCRFSHGVYVW